jgi:hypothetical protein
MKFENKDVDLRLAVFALVLILIGSLLAWTGASYAQEETGECLYMKDVCKELEDYKANSQKLTHVKKNKAEAKEKITKSLTERFNEAKKLCKESEKKIKK